MRGPPRANYYLFLLALLLAVPALAGCAGVAAFLLRRAGYTFLVWGVLPLIALLLVTGCLGVILGRAAIGAAPDARRPGDPEEPRRRDDV